MFCAPRCRDLGRGFDLAEMLELVRNFRPCRRGSESKRSIDVCHICSYICAMYTYTMSIYDHIWNHMMFFLLLMLIEIQKFHWLRTHEIAKNFRAWGRAWPRALLSLQRRSIRSLLFVFFPTGKKLPKQDIQDRKVSYHAHTWEIDNAQCCHLAIVAWQAARVECPSVWV